MSYKCGFATFEKQSNRPTGTIGSTRIRARWLYENWKGAEEYQIGQKYDVMIFQKVYWEKMMEQFDGLKIMDLCDPDWLDGKDVMRYCDLADAVVTSTEALAEEIRKYITGKPVICIPDRVEMKEHTPYQKKAHADKIKNVVWFGYLQNTVYIENTLKHLQNRGLNLTIVADREYYNNNYEVAIQNIKWSYPAYHEAIAGCDVALLPKDRNKDKRGMYKSNNKVLTAWALKLPVVQEPEDFDRLATKEARETEAKNRLKEIEDTWLVQKSVSEYKVLIERIKNV